MKKLLSIACFTLLFVGAWAQESKPAAPKNVRVDGAHMKFDAVDIDYGTIAQDAEPNRTFKFENTGNQPLDIKNAQGSCGCTIPTWPHEPILPGKSGTINVHYDTHRVGPFTKNVTLTTNAPGQESLVLTIHGTVNAAPATAPAAPANNGTAAPKAQ